QVVKMRKDVKKIRVLTIRRLTRHIGKLKLKKGSEDLILKNQKRAERLIEEIHAMKEIKPDQVTRLALRKEVNFESVCRKPKSTATERAIARLATHPILKSKIAELKAAVQAFKDARKTPAKTQLSIKNKSEEHPKSVHLNSDVENQVLKVFQKQQACENKAKMSMKLGDNTEKELSESEYEQKIGESEEAYTPKEVSLQAAEGQAVAQSKVGKKFDYPNRKQNISITKFTATKESVSDVSDGEQHNEKEYFDDSTEERFYNQSSDSDSDSNDDFFIGRVKRKKKITADSDFSSVKGKNKPHNTMLKKENNTMPRTVQDLIGEEEKLQAKTTKLESVFCSTLSTSSNQKPQNRSTRDVGNVLYYISGTAFSKKEPQLKKLQLDKAAGTKCKNKKTYLEQPLHPSWEASKKRREQMSQITVFQGKKIKFDD
ncbi:SRFB1 protein, partial [Crypturellus undulatus]|nr:SRFB1 protein [Crypturellus undulatus]